MQVGTESSKLRFCLFVVFQDSNSSACLGTHCVDQSSLKLHLDLPASVSHVLGLKVCGTTAWIKLRIFNGIGIEYYSLMRKNSEKLTDYRKTEQPNSRGCRAPGWDLERLFCLPNTNHGAELEPWAYLWLSRGMDSLLEKFPSSDHSTPIRALKCVSHFEGCEENTLLLNCWLFTKVFNAFGLCCCIL